MDASKSDGLREIWLIGYVFERYWRRPDFQSSLVPNNALKAGSTDFVFANTGVSYILYSDSCGTDLNEAMTTEGVYWVVRQYMREIGINDTQNLGVHSLRATAATNA